MTANQHTMKCLILLSVPVTTAFAGNGESHPDHHQSILPAGGCLNTRFSLSPTGENLAFEATDGQQSVRYALNLNTHTLHRLVNGYEPHWSPDGHWIAFQQPLSPGKDGIFRIRLNGRDLQFLAVGDHAQWSSIVNRGSAWTWICLFAAASLLEF